MGFGCVIRFSFFYFVFADCPDCPPGNILQPQRNFTNFTDSGCVCALPLTVLIAVEMSFDAFLPQVPEYVKELTSGLEIATSQAEVGGCGPPSMWFYGR